MGGVGLAVGVGDRNVVGVGVGGRNVVFTYGWPGTTLCGIVIVLS